LRNEATRSIGQGRFQRDGDGRFTIVNTEFERIAGRPRGEILGRRGDELELGVGGRRFSAHDGPEVLEPGGTELFEEVLDGRTYVSLRFPLTSADGRILGMAGISTDVTARHRAEERFPARVRGGADRHGADVARGSLPARQPRCARSPGAAGGDEARLDRPGIDPNRLMFEITETAAVASFTQARSFADRLHELGCGFALDDFGAGFGSFYYLKHLPFDYLKIDGEFVANCVRNPTDRLVIAPVVDIARGMGKKTIAEFVAGEPTQRVVESLGVDHAQGDYVGTPGPLAALSGPAPRT
jgi:EAL domain/PAS fold